MNKDLFPKIYNVFNYTTIGVVVVFLVLIITESISRETYMTLLYITIAILAARIIARIYLIKYLKKNSTGE